MACVGSGRKRPVAATSCTTDQKVVGHRHGEATATCALQQLEDRIVPDALPSRATTVIC